MSNRHPRYNQGIVDNLRSIRISLGKEENELLIKQLSSATDDEVYNAYELWSTSVDYPDETLIPEWIGVNRAKRP